MISHLEMWVQVILKLGAHAHGEVALAGERVGGAHQLLKVRLNGADDLITVVVGVDLANVVNYRMRLI